MNIKYSIGDFVKFKVRRDEIHKGNVQFVEEECKQHIYDILTKGCRHISKCIVNSKFNSQ